MTIPDKKVQGRKATPAEKQKSEKRKQQIKYYGVVAMLSLLCCGFIYFIFRPAQTDESQAQTGLIMTVPEASTPVTEGDKQKAYDKEQYEKRQEEKMQSMQEMQGANSEYLTSQPKAKEKNRADADPIRQSQDAYKQVSQQMNSFYSAPPRKDTEVDDLKKQVAELTAKLENRPTATTELDPIAMMEKSYELAAKYSPSNNSPKAVPTTAASAPAEKRNISTAHRASDNVVSSLSEDFDLTPDRNYSFNTAVGTNTVLSSNSVHASVSEDQVLTTGGRIKLRLLESLMVGDVLVPANAPIYGVTRIEGQRLSVVVSSIE